MGKKTDGELWGKSCFIAEAKRKKCFFISGKIGLKKQCAVDHTKSTGLSGFYT